MKLKPGTHERDDAYMEALEHFFGRLHLRDITPGHLRGYQVARKANQLRHNGVFTSPWKHAATNSTINHELALLGRILSHCRLWKNLREYYFPLPVPKWSPREIMGEGVKRALFHPMEPSTQRPSSLTLSPASPATQRHRGASCATSGSRKSFCATRRRIRSLAKICTSAEGVKNDSRPRKIALNRTARWAVQQLYKRALRLGCCEPEHFLFPFRLKRNDYDPERPAGKTFLRKSWAALRQATRQPDLQPHDLRHHCITRLLEHGVEPETVRSIAGHLRPEMTEYYSHQRKRVKYKALAAIDPTRKKPPTRTTRPSR